jgi:hypothetical protein
MATFAWPCGKMLGKSCSRKREHGTQHATLIRDALSSIGKYRKKSPVGLLVVERYQQI